MLHRCANSHFVWTVEFQDIFSLKHFAIYKVNKHCHKEQKHIHFSTVNKQFIKRQKIATNNLIYTAYPDILHTMHCMTALTWSRGLDYSCKDALVRCEIFLEIFQETENIAGVWCAIRCVCSHAAIISVFTMVLGNCIEL